MPVYIVTRKADGVEVYRYESAGRPVGVAYADGRSKAFTWTGYRLTRVDTLRPGLPTLRADLTYNPDGTLATVAQSEV